MDCYDEILELYHEEAQTDHFLKYLTELINKKSKALTKLQFKNCLILTLAIWNPKFIDTFYGQGNEIKKIDKGQKEQLKKLLKSEFSILDN